MTGPGSKRLFPMQDGPPIPWGLAEAIYEHLYRQRDQSLQQIAERGGFGWAEVKYLWNQRWGTTDRHREACRKAVEGVFGDADG